MADKPKSKRPTPTPRKPRTGYHAVNVNPNPGYSPRPDIGHAPSPSVRYTVPVTPPSQFTSNLHPTPPYSQQTSTPLPSTPSTYQPPVTPASRYRSSQKKEYSGPNKIMTPQPMEGFSPRKDSWSSSRSSLSSDPSSPARMISDELTFEIDKLKDTKIGLNDEVVQLRKQRDQMLSDVTEHKKTLDELRTEHHKCSADLDNVLNEEMSVKRRIAQCEQNLQLMGRLSSSGDTETEQKLKKKEKELNEKEFALHEREARIRQKELEIKTEGDVLFQRKKELDIREYDLKNFQGPHQPVAGPGRDRHSDILGHEERERDLQHKEQHLFQKENRLTDWEEQLKREKNRLTHWEEKVQGEDSRAQLNISKAKSMMQEANKLKNEASGVPKVAGLLDKNVVNPGAGSNAAGNHGNPGIESNVVSTNVKVSEASTNEADCSDDLMYARLMNMQMNADMSEQDRLIALSMTTPQTPPDFLDTDAQLAYQQQLEILGIAPGSAGEEALKNRLQEQLDMEKKARETTARDEEIAASLRASD